MSKAFLSRPTLFHFLLLSLSTRFVLLFAIDINHDQATYLVIANEWLKGRLPFVDYLDIKPLGIYAIFAALIAIFGQSLIAIRLCTVLTVAATGYFLYRAKKAQGARTSTAFFTGGFYCVILATNFWGWTGNVELYFNLFTSAALFLLLWKTNFITAFYIGLLMGCGFNVKYSVLFDTAAFSLFLLTIPSVQLIKKIKMVMLIGIGMLLPFGVANLYYWLHGQYDAFWYASFVLPSRYQISSTLEEKTTFIISFYAYFLPITLLWIAGLWHRFVRQKANLQAWVLYVVWPALVWIIILAPGKLSDHYYMQAVLPFCFAGFDSLGTIAPESKLFRRLKISLAGLLVVAMLTGVVVQYLTIFTFSNVSAKNANLHHATAHLTSNLSSSDVLYTRRMILHFLFDISPIQRYVHPTLFTDQIYRDMFDVDVGTSFQQIKDAKPKYLFCTLVDFPLLQQYAETHYQKVAEYKNGDTLWERKPEK